MEELTLDFYKITEKITKRDTLEVSVDFKVAKSKDLMVRGKSFYAIWDEEIGLWSTDEYDATRLIDLDIDNYILDLKTNRGYQDHTIIKKAMCSYATNTFDNYIRYLSKVGDNYKPLDSKLIFSNDKPNKKDYATKRLSYPLKAGCCKSYDTLMDVLYDKSERTKLEWAIGAIISGDSKSIQKFEVLYGEAGTGKSTVLNIMQKLFEGYYSIFEAKTLTSSNNQFSMAAFKNNPLVGIDHDGDLSKIDDNTRLNSIVSHEEMLMNEKYKASYQYKPHCMLFIGSNKPVKMTDAKSGLLRRLIDVSPTGNKLPPSQYQVLYNRIDFELGAIAQKCLDVYREMGKNYYSKYQPLAMMAETNVFYNFVEEHYPIFDTTEGVALKPAYLLYKEYCEECLIEYKLPMHRFRDELKNYFKKFVLVKRVDGVQVRSHFSEFRKDKLFKMETKKPTTEEQLNMLTLDYKESLLDAHIKDCPAQYASATGKPLKKWAEVKETLRDLDTTKLHYVKPPEQHIVIDFDLTDATGKKSAVLNIEAASKWPTTYTEFSKSGNGIHLHYMFDGDTSKLSRIFSVGIEIKVFVGDASLRRKLTMNNNVPIRTINSGIPMKGEKMVDFEIVKNEKALRTLVKKNLAKKIHQGTKPSIDFIHTILEEAYVDKMYYDLKDLRPAVMAFANNSTNQSAYCLKLVNEMKFTSDEQNVNNSIYDHDELIFFDVEVFPNLFIVCWKTERSGVVKMINPSPTSIGELLKAKLVGFNNRRYDNHILYARYMGYTNEQLYRLSKRIIGKSANASFGEAYNVSYTDIYDVSSKKQSLKKFEIELGIHHQELGLSWDEPVPKEKWMLVADYCVNDVVATQAVFHDRKEDFIARKILSELSGLTPNDTTQKHTERILFGDVKNPQKEFVYTDLSEMFPGYEYSFGKSTYRGEEVGEGGYVYSEPGIYTDVALNDIASMHPFSLINMNHFGPYTERFKELVFARMAIKHKNYDEAKTMLGGILAPYLTNKENSKKLAYAMKIIINIVYGMTSAKFENKFKDPRNVDNIVAKRGSLFMIDLKHAVKEKGWTVAHIKTDSIKIPNATPEMIDFVTDFGAKYGYSFEHEATYSKLALVNDAVYIAKDSVIDEHNEASNGWTATGTQFLHPYVFKTLFSKEPTTFDDLVEVKSVKTALYLDMNESLPDVTAYEKVKVLREKLKDETFETPVKMTGPDRKRCADMVDLSDEELDANIAEGHHMHFVGKVGAFVPIKPGDGGALLMREKDGLFHSASGAKGYRWFEAEYVKVLKLEDSLDYSYGNMLIDKAIENISQYGDFEWFTS
jgi:hypothetical protein